MGRSSRRLFEIIMIVGYANYQRNIYCSGERQIQAVRFRALQWLLTYHIWSGYVVREVEPQQQVCRCMTWKLSSMPIFVGTP